ncbi:SETD9 [Bugula neritina]|nr:SETD9 [Bugula neritina]
MTWKEYRHRFLPWIILNGKSRFRQCETSPRSFQSENIDAKYYEHNFQIKLKDYLSNVNHRLSHLGCTETFSQAHMQRSFKRDTEVFHKSSYECASDILGFSLCRSSSSIKNAGLGVFVAFGKIPKNSIAALYPGLIYEPGEPVLFQSIHNQFVLRCKDGVLVDGNDRGISKFLYR